MPCFQIRSDPIESCWHPSLVQKYWDPVEPTDIAKCEGIGFDTESFPIHGWNGLTRRAERQSYSRLSAASNRDQAHRLRFDKN